MHDGNFAVGITTVNQCSKKVLVVSKVKQSVSVIWK